MASNSEKGHAKNVANLQRLISFCNGYGAQYNPTQPAIKIPAMQALLTASNNSLIAVNTALTPWKVAVNMRQIAFETLRPTCTRVINALDACGASGAIVKDGRTYVRKISGKRVSAATPTAADAAGTSAVQRSFDAQVANFQSFISLLTGEPLYIPNESPLQIVQLNTYLTQLQTANTNVINTLTPWSNARVSRNNILYAPSTGLVDVALESKKYIKSVFGASSPQYKQVSGLEFSRVRD